MTDAIRHAADPGPGRRQAQPRRVEILHATLGRARLSQAGHLGAGTGGNHHVDHPGLEQLADLASHVCSRRGAGAPFFAAT